MLVLVLRPAVRQRFKPVAAAVLDGANGMLHAYLTFLAEHIVEPFGKLVQLGRKLWLVPHPSEANWLEQLGLLWRLDFLEDGSLGVC